jgi:uncharacterized protein YggE
MPFDGLVGERLRKAVLGAVIMLGLFLLFQAVTTVMNWRYIGTGVQATNTISVTGHGEMVAVPDIATFTFSVVSTKTTVTEAQTEATAKANAITAYLKSAGINEKDIQTTDYSISPQYDYQSAVCPSAASYSGASSAVYCPGGRQVLKGYEVRQTTTIKVRDTAKAGDFLAQVGSKGATELSGLNFTFDDPTGVEAEAREKAITDAKEKAKLLAKQLGVSLVRVVSFNESGRSPVYPMAYGLGGAAMAKDAAAPEISLGQNKLTSDVSITYEIR